MTSTIQQSKILNIGLWAAQLLLAVIYGMVGTMKMTQPLDKLVTMGLKFAGTSPDWFVRGLGAAEFLGAVGLILPWLLKIQPKLTVAAALCFTILQAFAIVYHAMHGETSQTLPVNLVFISLSAFVFWGRSKAFA